MQSITSIDTSKGCFWPLKTGLILAAAQHIPPGVHWSISSGMQEKRLWCCLPQAWARARLRRGRAQLCEPCSAVTQWDAPATAAFRQSRERCGYVRSQINPADRVEPPASGLALKEIHLVNLSCGVTGLQHPEEQKQAVLEVIKSSANSEKSPGTFHLVCPSELALNPTELLSLRVISFCSLMLLILESLSVPMCAKVMLL